MFCDIDFENTIKDFDYTKKSILHMNKVVDSEEFYDMDPETIFNYLYREMELVSFKDYLKRYLYERAGIIEDFSMIGDDVYFEIIKSSFEENCVPYSIGPTTRKRSVAFKQMLTSVNVKRQTIFLLGFGLRMTVDDVTEFLVKVIKEEDFNFFDKDEVIYWYCLKNQFSYLKAQEYQQVYDEQLPLMQIPQNETPEFNNLWSDTDDEKEKENKLFMYLSWLKASKVFESNQDKAFRSFESLLWKSKEAVADILNSDIDGPKKAQLCPDDITPGDLEKILYSGIPLNEAGNLQRSSRSLLQKQFNRYRLSRQRINSVLKKKIKTERFDLITLNFFVYSQMDIEPPEKRYFEFIKSTNAILAGCGMLRIYPVNPYESFIMMCLLTECPLEMYSDIWEMSYQEDNNG